MEIKVLVLIDGEQFPFNEELDSTISSIVNSYIKQKISGVKVKPAKDPNAPKREGRPHISPEEEDKIILRAKELAFTNSQNRTANIIAQEVGRSVAAVYKVIRNSDLKFLEPYNKPKEETSLRNIFQK